MCSLVHQQAARSQDHIPRVALHIMVLKSLQCHYASHPGPFIAVREQHGRVACISMRTDEGPRDTRQMKLFFPLWHTKEESVRQCARTPKFVYALLYYSWGLILHIN